MLRPHILYPHCIAFHSSSAVKASLLKEGPVKNKIFKIMRILSSNISSIALVKMITLEPCSIQAQCETLDRWRLIRVPALGRGGAGIPSRASDCRASRFYPCIPGSCHALISKQNLTVQTKQFELIGLFDIVISY